MNSPWKGICIWHGSGLDPCIPLIWIRIRRFKNNEKNLFEVINLYPKDLQNIFRLLATISVTQVSVELLFSALILLFKIWVQTWKLN